MLKGFPGPRAGRTQTRLPAGILFVSLATAIVLGLLLGAPSVTRAEEAQSKEELSAQQQLVEKAMMTFDRFLADRTTKAWYRKEARRATAVFIVPQFLRGAFIVGAAGGSGVLLARDFVKGGWSPPAFYRMSTASIGAQAGADSSEVVLLVLTQAGLERFHGTGTFRLGLDAGMTVGSLSDGGVDGLDVISFAWSKGLFAGMSFDGVGITAAPGDNHAYYGRAVEPEQIFKGEVTNAQADELRAAVSRMIR